jgi:fibronectin type 3 domain-containing protein
VTLASNYTVKRGTVTGGPYTTTVGTVTAPALTLTDSTGTSGTQYFYVVAAANNTVNGTTSTSISSNSTEATGTAVATPTGVSATAFSGNATLNWTAVTGATSYAVRRSTTNGSGYVTINSTVAGTPFVDSGLVNGTQYFYVVAAQATNGLSANSTQVSATPQGIPGSLVATAGTGSVALTWSAAAGVSSYVVKRGTVTGGPYTTLTSGASLAGYTDTAVVNGTQYFYVVAGLNSSGVGANSAEAAATPLAPPANLTATAGNGNITLNWSAAAGATAYTIKRATTSGAETVLATGVSTTNYKDTTAANGTPYFYTVTATNSSGASGSSSETTATAAGSPPSTPANLALTPGESNVTLNWSAASGAATYIVQRSDISGANYTTVNSAVATTSYLDTGLTDGNTYYYVVAAQNPAGTSANSAEANTTLAENITAWTAASFPGVTDANITGPAATPENDGVPNLLKYFYGLDPAAPAPANNPPVTSTTGPTNTVLFTFRLAKSATGLAYSIQSSTDLLNWTDTGVSPTVLSDQGTYYLMQATVPLGANPSLYLRLKVTTP